MILYLVRHGEAKTEEEDPLRPLSETGRQDIKKVASYASKLNIKVDQIFHSHKLRAMQTAEVLAESMKPSKGISEADGLAPLDNPMIWSKILKSKTNPIMLAGHLPHLGKLASLLLCGDANKNFIALKSAGIGCLKKEENETWSLQWMLSPEVVLLP